MMDGQVTLLPLADVQGRNFDAAPKDDAWFAEVAQAIKPQMYWYIVMPVGMQRKTSGGIILSDRASDLQKWTHGLGQIVCHGPSVYRGRAFAEAGVGPDDAPKAGDLVIYDPKTPKKFKFDGVELVQIPDNAIINVIDPDYASRVAWDYGF